MAMKFKSNQEYHPANSAEKHQVGAVIMDVQQSLLDSIDDRARLVENIALEANILKALKIPFCFTEQVPQKLGPTVPELINSSPGVSIFNKSTFSAFGCPLFIEWIEVNKISHLLVSGIETTICIYQTCIDALRKGLHVTTLSDCVGARRKDDALIALQQLRLFDCCIIPLETVAYSYLSDSTHSSFKDVSKLVKERIK